ncbi:hypothetical protein GCM10023231_41430 [Olivibacter ginsenosidimutans]|uniref:DUF4974 domain-containing protein n=1 Tax=Olivibacter ginsenosidimutans TaxID=1176537 RepID=A0ABP9CCK8_9SPHI
MEHGEAFFDIARDPTRPFMLDLQHTQVHVLGTRFNVRQQRNQNTMTLTLESGKIVLEANGQQEVLHRGEQLIYNIKEEKVLSIMQVDLQRTTAWRNGILRFEETPMKEVLHTLSNYYGVQFVGQKKFHDDMLFTAQFKAEPLKRVLELIELSTDLHFRQEQHQIIIY